MSTKGGKPHPWGVSVYTAHRVWAWHTSLTILTILLLLSLRKMSTVFFKQVTNLIMSRFLVLSQQGMDNR